MPVKAKGNGSIVTHLRSFRTHRGLSLFRLGAMIGRTPEAIRAYERGIAYPRGDVMFKIAEVLGVAVRDIWPNVERSGP